MWGDKRYHSLNWHLREKFGEKVMKVSLDGGFTCPNRDGTISAKGCIFCSERGSGDFAGARCASILEQFDQVSGVLSRKWKSGRFIAYFQAFTNTYAPVFELKRRYDEALSRPGVVGLAIATRPDCLDEETVRLIAGYAKDHYTWVELGLQTSNDETARRINRGYELRCYDEAMALLKQYEVEAVTHVIFGLPGERSEDMLKTVRHVRDSGSKGIKFHLLHLMRHTPLEQIWQRDGLRFLEQAEYVDLICRAIGSLDPMMVVHRLTGDAPRALLIGPLWSLDKWAVLNQIDEELKRRDIVQGSLRKEER